MAIRFIDMIKRTILKREMGINDDSNIAHLDEEFRLLSEKRKKLAELTKGLANLDDSADPIFETNEEKIETKTQKEKPESIDSHKPETSKEQKNLDEVLDVLHKEEGTSEKEDSTEYDDGKLALSKDEILEFCDRIIEKWTNDPAKDARHIFAMNAVKTSVIWTEEDTLKEIWKEIFTWAFEILYKNAVAQAKGDNMKWSQILDQVGKR